jgi:hypothetical protein
MVTSPGEKTRPYRAAKAIGGFPLASGHQRQWAQPERRHLPASRLTPILSQHILRRLNP